jgi:hypothetical protein
MDIDSADMRIIRRECGGYLALSISNRVPKIGVTAVTEDEACIKLNATLERWLEILDAVTEPACHAPDA